VAVALLGVLWIVTVTTVGQANQDSERRREKDRLPLADAYAGSARE
jgi:hypothetical protein